MSRPRQTTRAFLLGSVAYKEADRVVTLFTEDHGRVSALARGARRSQRRFGGALGTFGLMRVDLAAGRGSLLQLTGATLIDANLGLGGTIERMSAASLLVDLCRQVLPEDAPEPVLFDLLRRALARLATSERHGVGPTLLAGEVGALDQAGLAVNGDRCSSCGRPVPPGRPVRFHPIRGGVVCTPCGGGPLLISAVGAEALADLVQLPFDEASELEIAGQAVLEIQHALDAFIEHHLGRIPPTRSFLQL